MNTLASLSILLFCIVTVVYGQACGAWGGCGSGMCCSKWGFCGNTGEHCGAGCLSNCKGAPAPSSGGSVRCGANWADANNNCARKACKTSADCGGQTCFKDLKSCGGSTPKPPPPPTNTGPVPTGSGSISAIINQNDFNRALSACGINKPNLYNELRRGFTATLPGGKKELALLMGNMAHESGAFNFVEEIRCAGVNHVTGECPYGKYHGRGYIQLSWDYNYRAAADYLRNPRIFNEPDIVMNDPTVNWQTVQWFWVTNVQDTFRRRGYTMGASVRAINGGLECDNGPINPQRVKFIQCFERNYGVAVDQSTACPARALGDQQSEFSSENSSQQTQLPSTFVVALVVLGTITLVLGVIVVVIVVILGKRMRSQEHV